jgi:hypothetical protein
VHLFVTYPNAQLELQSTVDDTGWRAACMAPCDREVDVDATEARVSAPGMTTSNTFQIEPGRGTARFKVNGGSASHRQIGIITLAAGIPIALTGMGLYGYGVLEDKKGFRTAGTVTLAIGAATVIAALPFLGSGSTRVYDAKGKNVASSSRFDPPRF